MTRKLKSYTTGHTGKDIVFKFYRKGVVFATPFFMPIHPHPFSKKVVFKGGTYLRLVKKVNTPRSGRFNAILNAILKDREFLIKF